MNRNSIRWAVMASACLAPLAFATPALAQAADAADDEIIVTARRTSESLQEVPASVSAFSEQQLARIGAVDSTGLQGAVPNLNIVQGRGSSNATNIFIRGVGQPDALQTFDPAVGFYVDDVYYSRIRGTQLEMFDIERVEVLRGPQGTLYGKNTIGGALKIVTRRPSDDPSVMLQATIGDYGQVEARGSFAGPLTENLAGSVSLFGATRDGYVTNPNTGEDYNDRNVVAGRTQLAWDPSSTVSIDWSADYAEEDNALVMGQPVNTLNTLFGVPILVRPAQLPEFNFHATPTPGLPNSTTMTHWGTSLRASWEVAPNFTLRSISAWRELEYADYVDIDATQLETGDVLVDVTQQQRSQEFQGIYDGERIDLVGGVYYMNEHVKSAQFAFADDLLTGPGGFTFLRTVNDALVTTSWAAFVNGSFDITDRLSVSAGVRYTEEEKEYDRTTSTFSNFPGLTANPAFRFVIDETWTNTSAMASIDYQLTDNALLYARVAQGFKSGGFNGRSNNPGEQAPYAPEEVLSYEVGLKTDWWNNRVVANFAAFYSDYQDFQARVSGLTIDPGTGLPSPELSVLNAGALEIQGAEAELVFRATDALSLNAQIGYLDAAYGEFDDVRFVAFGGSRAFQEPAFSPDWTARFGGTYSWDLADGAQLDLNASARYRSRMALAVDNTLTNSAVEIEGLFQDEYWLYDASLVWTESSGRGSLGLYGRNLSDEVYKTDGQEFSSVGNIRTVYYGAPRTVSLVATYRY
jgi:iron complex outermembrane receptor protein